MNHDAHRPIYVSKIEDLPEGEHFVILEQGSIAEHDYYDKDGGYTSRSVVTYIAFRHRENWEEEIRKRSTKANGFTTHTKWVALVVKQPKITVSIDVKVAD